MKVSHGLTGVTGSRSLYQHMERILYPVLSHFVTKQRRLEEMKMTFGIYDQTSASPSQFFKMLLKTGAPAVGWAYGPTLLWALHTLFLLSPPA
jgi:hypothetical protein